MTLTEEEKDNIYYVCCLIEYIARHTANHRGRVAACIGHEGIQWLLDFADVNHCLSFEQVSDETIEEHGIPTGDYDTVKACRHAVPSFIQLSRIYQILVLRVMKDDAAQAILDVFGSVIIDSISRFDPDILYRNPDDIYRTYLAGRPLPCAYLPEKALSVPAAPP